MAVAVSTIINNAKILLHDEDDDNRRWPDTELVSWISAGQREAVIHKPDVYMVTAAVQLSAGSKQTIPTGGVQLVDVYRNMGTTGTTAGNAIVPVDRKTLDRFIPGWHAATAAAAVRNIVFDGQNPKVFFVYPPNTGTGYVELAYSLSPANVSLGGNIVLDDIWESALTDYVVYRALMKDSDSGESEARAVAFYRNFLIALGAKDKAESLYDPNRQRVQVNG